MRQSPVSRMKRLSLATVSTSKIFGVFGKKKSYKLGQDKMEMIRTETNMNKNYYYFELA